MQPENTPKTSKHRLIYQNKNRWVALLLLGVLTGIFFSCHKDSDQPDCGCNAVITDDHHTGVGHLTPTTDSLDQKIWVIKQNDQPGKMITITICNLNDAEIKEVTDQHPKDTIRVKFAGKLHEECPPSGAHIPEYAHLTMTVDTLTPLIMVPL